MAARQSASRSPGSSPGLPLFWCKAAKCIDQIAEEVEHAARIFLAEAAERAQRAARIEWENRLQMRRILLGRVELLRTETGNADHADVAVTPWLLGDPFDQIVAVPLAASAAI